ncbi:MAG: hypothetical protein IJ251_08070 [Oscillospiraceae bacterium]|nr:hypothetical protein [Oscillospiraceae bacterium]
MFRITAVILALMMSTAPAAQIPSDTDMTLSAVSSQAQTGKTVSYLGPEGTYTQEACGKFFDGRGTYAPYATVEEAVQALTEGRTDFAVIPQENTIGGAVTDYVDVLIGNKGVYVAGEVELPIDQDLLVIPGTQAEEIKTVYSHKQGIAQGREWVEKNLPNAELIEVSSTAEGAKKVSESGDKSCAAIASGACADVYGLEIKAQAIQNNDRNKTRFYVLAAGRPTKRTGERTAFVASGKASDLPRLMTDIRRQKMTLVYIHDRPLKTELGEYAYIIECSGAGYEKYLSLKEGSAFKFRYLGSFDVR